MEEEKSNTQVLAEQRIQEEMHATRTKEVTASNRMFWYSAKELAEYYGVCQGTIYVWMHNGYFPYLQQGGRLYVHTSTVDWIDRVGKSLIVSEKRLFPRLVHTAVSIGKIALPDG